jgi:flagellar hook-associated protein 1 FlgK
MNLFGALTIANTGLANVGHELAVVSQNVANAGTAGYTREVATPKALAADGFGLGVATGVTGRVTDDALSASVLASNAEVAGLQTTQAALQPIDSVQGTPGQGGDLASLLGRVQDAFATLANDPASTTQQQAVIGAAGTLAQAINATATAYQSQRQAAQDGLSADVKTLNDALGTIGALSDRIVALRAQGQSTADLESQRDAALQSVGNLVGIKVLAQTNGDVVVATAAGAVLPTHGAPDPVSIAPATVDASTYYPGGGLPGIVIGGADVSAQLTGGSIGARLTLRDTTLPTYQAELDEFSHDLATRFDAQGLRLFSDGAGNLAPGGGVPAQSGYVGFAGAITVNPAVTAQPALVRDGTQTVAGSPTGATAFTPNPPGGPAGFTGLVTRILDFALGPEVQAGIAQPPPSVAGLGPNGTLSAPYAPPATPADGAAALIAAQSQTSAAATTRLGTESAVQSSLQAKLTSETGVKIDSEMSSMVELQNAYGANARVLTAAQAMWTQLLNAVQ